MTHAQVIETAHVRVEWRAPHPCRLIVVHSTQASAFESGAISGEEDLEPLREETTYGLLVQARNATALELRHPDPTVLRGIHRSADGRTLHGTIATRAQVGRLRLAIALDEKPHLVLEAEVVPTKVDAETLTQIRDEVESAVAGLALRYLRITDTSAAPRTQVRSNGGGWLRLVEAALDPLEQALQHISRAPTEANTRTAKVTRPEAIRRPDSRVQRTLSRRVTPGWINQTRERRGLDPHERVGVVLSARRLMASQIALTLDTPEHRWLRGQLGQAHAALHALFDAEAKARSHVRQQAHLESLDEALRRVRALLRLNPISSATSRALPAPSLRLRRARYYRHAYEAARLLRLGLALGAGRVRTSLADLAQLYEQWCFVTVARLLQRYLGAPQKAAGFATVDTFGFHLRLRQGTAHALSFVGAQGMRVRLAYQPRFGHPALLPQRPDMLLTIEQSGLRPRRIVLDAKYRRDDSAAAVRRYGQPAPPSDAIADLHRYRDAIRDADGARIIDQAIALYPYTSKDAGVEVGPLWQSIADLGVGALPLLPQTKQHLDAWLRQVLLVGTS